MSIQDEGIEYRCGACHSLNRIPAARLGDTPRCGRCKQPLFPDHPVVATDRSFADEVEATPIPVLVDFWAPWCGPCRTIAPSLEAIAREQAGRVKVVKVNVDENPGLQARFGVRSIPALKLFRGSRVVEEIVGAMPKNQILAQIAPHL
ncbi:MAG: thioredoxin TrxC [Pseudomonadota bacterium]